MAKQNTDAEKKSLNEILEDIESRPGPVAVPSNADILAKLPRLARIAFAARCARRVHALVYVTGVNFAPASLDSIDAAIDLAEKHAGGRGLSGNQLRQRMGEVKQNITAFAESLRLLLNQGNVDKHAMALVAQSLNVTNAAASAMRSIDGQDNRSASAASKAAGDDFVDTHIHNDFLLLSHFAEEDGWTDETPVAPERFGSMWPHGAPKDWPNVDLNTGYIRPGFSGKDVQDIADLEKKNQQQIENLEVRLNRKVSHLVTEGFDARAAQVLEQQNSLGKLQDQLTERIDESQKLLESLRVAIANTQKQFESDQKSLQKFLVQTSNELKGIKEAYRTGRAAAAPIKYWSDRAVHHEAEEKRRWNHLSIAGIGAFVLAIGVFLVSLFTGDLTIEDVNPWRLGSAILIGTLTLLLLRVVTRMMLSHMHLASESRERVVMMETYLALAEEGKLDETHRVLILQALFRPSSTGLVKDDAVPASVLDLATRISSGGTSSGKSGS